MFSWLRRKPETRSLFGSELLTIGQFNSDAGVTVNDRTVLQVCAVRACIDIIAQAISSLSLHVYRRDDNGRTRSMDHPLYRILHSQPNSDMTSVVWLESLLNRVLLYGASFDFLDRQNGQVVGIYPLDNHRVRPHRRNGQLLYEVTIADGRVARPS